MLVYGGVEGSVWVCSGVVGGEEGLGKGEAFWEEELVSSLTQSNVELESVVLSLGRDLRALWSGGKWRCEGVVVRIMYRLMAVGSRELSVVLL